MKRYFCPSCEEDVPTDELEALEVELKGVDEKGRSKIGPAYKHSICGNKLQERVLSDTELSELEQLLDKEGKRVVREQLDGIIEYKGKNIDRDVVFELFFEDEDGSKVARFYRLRRNNVLECTHISKRSS